MTEHIYGIFKNMENNNHIPTETAIHFSQNGHSVNKHFKFMVFQSNLLIDEKRWSVETDLINLFLARNIQILNLKQRNISLIKNLTFLN